MKLSCLMRVHSLRVDLRAKEDVLTKIYREALQRELTRNDCVTKITANASLRDIFENNQNFSKRYIPLTNVAEMTEEVGKREKQISFQ